MPNAKRASMREGPLAALFRKTGEEAEPAHPDSPRQADAPGHADAPGQAAAPGHADAPGQDTVERPALAAPEAEQGLLPEATERHPHPSLEGPPPRASEPWELREPEI